MTKPAENVEASKQQSSKARRRAHLSCWPQISISQGPQGVSRKGEPKS